MRLGKLAPRHDERTLRLARYMLPERLPVPPACDWSTMASEPWGMLGNDLYGDCAVASPAHLVHAWSAAAGREQVLTRDEVLATYAALTGFDPARPETDGGAVVLDVLKMWRKDGIGGHTIGAFAAVDVADLERVRAAIALFGGAVAGLQLPLAAQNRDAWDVSPAEADTDASRGSWGGHAVAVVGFAERGLLAITWGKPLWMSWGFFTAYADECWAAIGEDFLTGDHAPNGLEVATLRADLDRIAASAST